MTFCVTLSTSDVFSGDHPTRNGLEQLLLQRSTTQRKEAVVETSVCAIRRSESGRGRYKRSRSRNVQEVVRTEQRETNKVRRVSRNHERVGEERVHGREMNLRRKAAEELTVIDKEERKRRGWFWFVFVSSNPFRRVVSPSFLRERTRFTEQYYRRTCN